MRAGVVTLLAAESSGMAPAAMCSGIVNCENLLGMDRRLERRLVQTGREKLNWIAVPVIGVSGTVGAVAGRGRDKCFSLSSSISSAGRMKRL